MKKFTIAIGSDHAGFAYKEKIKALLLSEGHTVRDFGTNSDAACDYPDFIRPVAEAVARHPSRFAGFFMHNPKAPGADALLTRALTEWRLRAVCLFPAMHGYRLDDDVVEGVFRGAATHGAAVFAHCGVLTVGVRQKLGLPSRFDLRLGDPLALGGVLRQPLEAAGGPELPALGFERLEIEVGHHATLWPRRGRE